MPAARPISHAFARRKPPHRIVIAHGENVRSFTIRPWAVAVCGVVFLAFATIYLAATGYLIFRDDLLAASISRQARMQTAYEDRIAALRSDIDRLTSRQLLNQEAVEAEVERLVGRQAALDARQDMIAGISQAIRRAGLVPRDETDVGLGGARTVEEAPAPDAGIGGPSAHLLMPASFGALAGAAPAPVHEMEAVASSLDELAREQVAFVDTVATAVAAHTGKIEAAIKALGHRPPRDIPAEGIGGPFVPVADGAASDTFRVSVELVAAEIERLDTVRRFANRLPLAQPVQSTITSRFGTRIDPFLGTPAMHTGIDFRAPTGTAARATADGTVITAEMNGGYGNMVEVDHGNGITTRFAHLSRIDVTRGQVVSRGTVVGQSGNTGRSTGPHLHYEVRIDGAPIDPFRYVKAGREIGPLL